jgi:hypothetical protein
MSINRTVNIAETGQESKSFEKHLATALIEIISDRLRHCRLLTNFGHEFPVVSYFKTCYGSSNL